MFEDDMAVCDQHQKTKLECFYCDLVQETYWKEKYLQILNQHMDTVKELYKLELKYEG